jgi:hypothetical protein
MLLGIYKSFSELEDHLTIDEMTLMLKADAEKEERNHKVLAAVNGIPWGGGKEETGEDAMERIKKEAAARIAGKTVEQIDLEEFGIKIEVRE